MRYRVIQPRDVLCPVANHLKDARVCIKGPYPECLECVTRRKEKERWGNRWFYLVELEQRPVWAKEWVEVADDGTEKVVQNEAYQEAPPKRKNSFWDGFRPSSPSTYAYRPRQTEPRRSETVQTPPRKKKPTLGDVGMQATLNRSVHRSQSNGAESKRKRKASRRKSIKR